MNRFSLPPYRGLPDRSPFVAPFYIQMNPGIRGWDVDYSHYIGTLGEIVTWEVVAKKLYGEEAVGTGPCRLLLEGMEMTTIDPREEDHSLLQLHMYFRACFEHDKAISVAKDRWRRVVNGQMVDLCEFVERLKHEKT